MKKPKPESILTTDTPVMYQGTKQLVLIYLRDKGTYLLRGIGPAVKPEEIIPIVDTNSSMDDSSNS